MNIKDLKEIIKDLPDEMPFILFDLSTDDPYVGNYKIDKENFEVLDLTRGIDDHESPFVEGLALCFKNNMNPNPI